MVYLTIIPWARVGYEMIDICAELAIIISYPTSASGIIVLLKTPTKYRKLDYNKNKKAQKITHTLTIFVAHGIMAHIPWWFSQWKSRIALSNDPVFNNYIYNIARALVLSNSHFVIMNQISMDARPCSIKWRVQFISAAKFPLRLVQVPLFNYVSAMWRYSEQS